MIKIALYDVVFHYSFVLSVAILYDLDVLQHTIQSLKMSFFHHEMRAAVSSSNATKGPNPFEASNIIHCFAIKSCPVSFILRYCIQVRKDMQLYFDDHLLHFKY